MASRFSSSCFSHRMMGGLSVGERILAMGLFRYIPKQSILMEKAKSSRAKKVNFTEYAYTHCANPHAFDSAFLFSFTVSI